MRAIVVTRARNVDGVWFREQFAKRKLTQTEFGERVLGLDRAGTSRLLNGQNALSAYQACVVAEFFSVSIEEICVRFGILGASRVIHIVEPD